MPSRPTLQTIVNDSNDLFAQKGNQRGSSPGHLRLVTPTDPLPAVLSRRDPELVRRLFPLLTLLTDHYYRLEVEGAELLSDRACVTVSTHNGGWHFPDFYCLLVTFLRRFGLETPGYGMMHGAAFKVPVLGKLLTQIGAIHASRHNARLVLDAGYPLFVCPGGDEDTLKPFRRRHQIVFGKRRGFVRMAIERQVPIIPVVSVGAHEVFYVLNDGRATARALRFDRLFRIKTVPLVFGFPLGLTIAGLGTLPLPSKVSLRVLPPIELDERPERASDPDTVERCFQHVRGQMQRALDGLAATRRYPVIG